MRNVPKLRFKEFSGDWEEKKLGEVLKIGNGKDYKNLEQGEIPVYGTGGLITKVNDWLYDGESVGIGRKGTINKPMFLTGKFWTVDTLFYTYDFNNSIPKFIYYIFNNIDWLSYNEATGVPSLSKSTILKIKSFFSNLQEQQKIADFLSSVDKKISITEAKLDLFKDYKKGIMQKIFNQELRFKDSNGNNYPEWEEKRLEEIGEFKNGVNKGKDDFGTGYPFVNLLDIFEKNSISNNKNLSLVKVTSKELNEFNLKKGDILFIRSSVKPEGVGLTTVILTDLKNTVYSGFIIRFRENIKLLSLNYKKYCFYEEKFRKELLSKSTVSANTNINQDNLKTLIIKLPCLEEQQKIADFLSSIDNKIENLVTELEDLKEFKKGLLQQMFV